MLIYNTFYPINPQKMAKTKDFTAACMATETVRYPLLNRHKVFLLGTSLSYRMLEASDKTSTEKHSTWFRHTKSKCFKQTLPSST